MSFKESRRLAACAALLGLGLLQACNWQPLYATNQQSGYGMRDYLAQVQIQPLANRTGQQLHNLLRDRINPQGQPSSPGYYLLVTLTEEGQDFMIRRDETASRVNLRLTGDYILVAKDGQQVLFRGQAIGLNSYNVLDSAFATANARDAAREEAMVKVANTIETQLSAFFLRASQDQQRSQVEPVFQALR